MDYTHEDLFKQVIKAKEISKEGFQENRNNKL